MEAKDELVADDNDHELYFYYKPKVVATHDLYPHYLIRESDWWDTDDVIGRILNAKLYSTKLGWYKNTKTGIASHYAVIHPCEEMDKVKVDALIEQYGLVSTWTNDDDDRA